MDPKTALTNGVFCPMPWTGLMYNFDGSVKNCIRSAGYIGDLKQNNIQDILTGNVNSQNQQNILSSTPVADCHTCYDLEQGKKNFDIVSDRIFYIKELKKVPFETYQQGNHDLRTIDVRWSNLCNFACVYCSPRFSSRWSQELGIYPDRPSDQQLKDFKQYIFDHASQLKHVYIAGGEPLLMKENLELLQELKKTNIDVNLRINTNLSRTDSKVFEAICEFPNVHWTVSVESIEDEFEYIRYGGKWEDFLDNLSHIKQFDHKVTFNMLYFLLNYNSLFDTIRYFQNLGFHNNSFVIGPLLEPLYLNVRHLPDNVLNSLKQQLSEMVSKSPGHLLEDSLKNLLFYLDQPFQKNLENSFLMLQHMDQRRDLDSKKIFKELYSLK